MTNIRGYVCAEAGFAWGGDRKSSKVYRHFEFKE